MSEASTKAESIDQSPLKGKARTEWENGLLGQLSAMGKNGEKKARTRAWNHTLLALLNFAQGKADCFPSKAAIAARLGANPKTVFLNLKAMDEAGLIAIVEDGSIRVGRRIVFPSHPNAEAVLRQFPEYVHRGKNAPCAPKCTEGVSGTCTEGVSTRCTEGTIMPSEPNSSETKSFRNQSLKQPSQQPGASPRTRGPAQAGGVDGRSIELEAEWHRQYAEAMANDQPVPRWKLPGQPPQDIMDLIDAWLDDHPEYEATLPPPQGSRDIDCIPAGGLCGECPACEERDRRCSAALQRWFKCHPSLERLASEAIAFYEVDEVRVQQEFYREVYECSGREAEMWGLLDWLKARPRKPRTRRLWPLIRTVIAWERKRGIDPWAGVEPLDYDALPDHDETEPSGDPFDDDDIPF